MQVKSLKTIFVPSQILFKKPDINLGDNSSGCVTKKETRSQRKLRKFTNTDIPHHKPRTVCVAASVHV